MSRIGKACISLRLSIYIYIYNIICTNTHILLTMIGIYMPLWAPGKGPTPILDEEQISWIIASYPRAVLICFRKQNVPNITQPLQPTLWCWPRCCSWMMVLSQHLRRHPLLWIQRWWHSPSGWERKLLACWWGITKRANKYVCILYTDKFQGSHLKGPVLKICKLATKEDQIVDKPFLRLNARIISFTALTLRIFLLWWFPIMFMFSGSFQTATWKCRGLTTWHPILFPILSANPPRNNPVQACLNISSQFKGSNRACLELN